MSNASELSPTRSETGARTVGPLLMDSPCRVTRSQVKRLSNVVPVNPSSPKPSTAKRRSVRVQEPDSDSSNHHEVLSTDQRGSKTTKSSVNNRRMSRKFSKSGLEIVDNDMVSSQGSQLESIEEQARPITRRTRASLKLVNDPDSQISLSTTRRTRKSSVSSVASSITSSVASPPRRTRGRRDMSAKDSEMSFISETQENSPDQKKTPILSEFGQNSSPTNGNNKISPALSSAKSFRSEDSSKASSTVGISPRSVKGDTSFTTPRKLELNESDPGSKVSPQIKHSSSASSKKSSRRLSGRLSLSSNKFTPTISKFVEAPLDEFPGDSQATEQSSPAINESSFTVTLVSKHPENDNLNVSVGKNMNAAKTPGRLSLSSNKASPAKIPKFYESPMKQSPEKIQHEDAMSTGDKDGVNTFTAPKTRRSSGGRLSLSSNSASPAKFSNSPMVESTKEIQQEEAESAAVNEDGNFFKARRISGGRLSSLSKTASPSVDSKLVDSSLNESSKKIQPEESDSDSDVDVVTPSKAQRISGGRFSSLFKTSSPSVDSKLVESSLNESSKKIQPEESESGSDVDVVSPFKARLSSSGRFSISSNAEFPAKTKEADGSLACESPAKVQCDEVSTDESVSSPQGIDHSKRSSILSAERHSLNSSELSLKQTGIDHDLPLEATEITDGLDSVKSPVKFPLMLGAQRCQRASTGRLSLGKSDKLGVKSKSRVSLGNLTSVGAFNDLQQTESGNILSLLHKSDSPEHSKSLGNTCETGMEHRNSPKKQVGENCTDSDKSDHESVEAISNDGDSDNEPFSHDESMSPSKQSSVESDIKDSSQCSSNKSVSLTAVEEVGCKSLDGKKPPDAKETFPCYDYSKKQKSSNIDIVSVEAPTNKTSSKIMKDNITDKVMKDAAYLLTGEEISGVESGSEGDDYELVFSPSTKSKKELRMEKKARKKAEKEARKKLKSEKMAKLSSLEEASNEVKPHSSGVGGDRKHGENHSESAPDNRVPKDQDSSRLSSNLFTAFPNSDDDGDDVIVESISEKEENAVEISILKGKETNSISESEKWKKDGVSDICGNVQPATCLEDTVSKVKKQKKKKKDKEAVGNECLDHDILPTPEENDKVSGVMQKKKMKLATNEEENETGDILTEKTNKKRGFEELEGEIDGGLKKKKVKKLISSKQGCELQNDLGSECAVSGEKKKKKKKHDMIEIGDAITDSKVGESLKKKKKKGLNQDLINTEVEQELESGSDVLLKKKKKKKRKTSNENQTTENDKINNETDPVDSLKKKIKKKESVEERQTSVPVDQEPPEIPSMKVKKSKKKSKAPPLEEIRNDESDSDDAPVSVSFAASKETALAEVKAAAENIRKQKERKREKMRLKMEKVKEEKLAKQKKMKKPSLEEGSEESTSQAYFEKTGYLPKATLTLPSSKPPKRLPADLLESLSEEPPYKLIKRPDGTKEKVLMSDLSCDERKRIEMKRAKKIAMRLKKQHALESEYIPLEGVLGATRFGVVPLRNIMLAKKLAKSKLAGEASSFRKESLFGNRNRRTPISTLLSYQEKLKASGKDQLVGHK